MPGHVRPTSDEPEHRVDSAACHPRTSRRSSVQHPGQRARGPSWHRTRRTRVHGRNCLVGRDPRLSVPAERGARVSVARPGRHAGPPSRPTPATATMAEELTLRHLESSDAPVVQQLFEADPEYFRRVTRDGPGPTRHTICSSDGKRPSPPNRRPFSGSSAAIPSSGSSICCADRPIRSPRTSDACRCTWMRGPRVSGGDHTTCFSTGMEEWAEITRLRPAIVQTNAEHAALFWSRWATSPSACPSYMSRDRFARPSACGRGLTRG